MKYTEIREAIIGGLMDTCGNCGAAMGDKLLRQSCDHEADTFFMPKLIPLLETLKKQENLPL